MNPDGRRIGVAGLAAVLPRVRGLRRLNEKPGGGNVATLLGYHGDAAPGTVVAQDVLIVVPEDVGWWLRTEAYGTRQVYRAARTDVQLGAAQYRRRRYCDKEEFFSRLPSPSLLPRSPRSSLCPPPPAPRSHRRTLSVIRLGSDKPKDPCVVKALRMKAFWERYLANERNEESLKPPRDP